MRHRSKMKGLGGFVRSMCSTRSAGRRSLAQLRSRCAVGEGQADVGSAVKCGGRRTSVVGYINREVLDAVVQKAADGVVREVVLA